jgi:hypothetical protein
LAAALMACGDNKSEGDEPTDPSDPIEEGFAGEVKPAVTASCYAGAYYRKWVSSKDVWLGIGGRVKLPKITFDPARVNPNKPEQYLDNPSVYLGGNAGGAQETDIGLTWEVIRDESGNVTADRRAFRPFMRRSACTATGQAANYSNAPAESRYYWYEGDEVTISVQVVADGDILFIVDGEGKHYETHYAADAYRLGVKTEYKRVNAIDQVNNEGKPAQATSTRVEGSVWYETYLFRSYDGSVVKAPMNQSRYTDMRCPDAKYFTITTTAASLKKGSEEITIN